MTKITFAMDRVRVELDISSDTFQDMIAIGHEEELAKAIGEEIIRHYKKAKNKTDNQSFVDTVNKAHT